MSANDWADLVESYSHWLKNGISVAEFGEYAELTTPFLDRHNDFVQIYARRTAGGGYTVTDDGAAITELESSGVEISTPTRSDILTATLRAFNVFQAVSGELTVVATPENVGQRINDLIQAVLSVEDMYVLARHRVARMFYEDVEGFLRDAGAVFSTREPIPGKSGYNQRVDFLLSQTNGTPQRLVQAIQNPTKQFVTREIFLIEDVRPSLEGVRPYAMLNDRDFEIPPDSLEAFDHYNITAVAWSQRESIKEELVGSAA